MKINDLALIENIDILTKNKLILYGIGIQGGVLFGKLKNINIPVAYFCDSNPKKHGIIIDGVKVLSPDELKHIDANEDVSIIVSVENETSFDSIINLMEKLELRTENVFSGMAFEISCIQNYYKYNPNCDDLILKTNKNINDHYKNSIDDSFFKSLTNFVRYSDNVLVYQPAKVGSSSVSFSLSKSGIDNTHIHNISLAVKAFDFDENYFSRLKSFIKNKDSVKIISLVREPIARALSLFFEIQMGNPRVPFVSMELGESFLDACSRNIKNEPMPVSHYYREFDWFDYELKETFDVDVYEYPFDREKGYSIIKQDNVEILLMKLEKLNTLENVIGDFVGVPDFKLFNVNEGDKKMYRFLYNDVKKNIKIPQELIDFYYNNNPRMDFFYTEDEKMAFLEKWEKNIENNR